MSKLRWDVKKDRNHTKIAGAFRELGWVWIDTHWAGQFHAGFPDGLACCDGRVLFVEVKSATGRLSGDQKVFREYLGSDAEYVVLRSAEEVYDLVCAGARGRGDADGLADAVLAEGSESESDVSGQKVLDRVAG